MPSVPNGWIRAQVRDLVDPNRRVTYGIVQPGPRQREEEGVPIIRGQDYSSGIVTSKGLYHVLPHISASYSRSTVRAGDLLLSIVGYVGTAAQVPPELGGANLTQTTARIAIEPPLSPRYFLHFFRTGAFRDEVKRFTKGSAQPGLNLSDVEIMRVSYPPLPEQRRIAEILDTLDEAIRKTEAIIAKLKQVKQGLLHDLLTRGIDDNGELRDPERHPEQFKDSPLGRIPKGWAVRRVGSLLSDIEQGWSPDCSSRPAEPGEWGVLRTTAVVWTGYQDHENKVLPRGLSPRPNYEVRLNDVLVTRAGPNSRVGVVALVEATQGRLMLSDKLYRLRPSREVEPGYLVLGLSGEATQRHLSTLKTGLAESQTNISQQIVRTLWFALPSREEQEAIIRAHDGLVRRVRSEDAECEKLRLLKHGLMEDLLTGHVRVTSLLEKAAE